MVRIIYSIEDNKRTASSQLIEQFKKYYIPISEIDEKIIKLRHDVFHGKPIAYGEDALIMKHIGHSGYIIEIKYYNNDNTQADISFYSYMDIGNLPT
jgi:Na+-translocating ferredoxin:NAD+ oxidoreductase RnfC subunit